MNLSYHRLFYILALLVLINETFVTVHEPHGLFDVATFPFSKLISKIIILCNSNLSKNTILHLKDNYYEEYFLNLKQVDFSFKNSARFLVYY